MVVCLFFFLLCYHAWKAILPWALSLPFGGLQFNATSVKLQSVIRYNSSTSFTKNFDEQTEADYPIGPFI